MVDWLVVMDGFPASYVNASPASPLLHPLYGYARVCYLTSWAGQDRARYRTPSENSNREKNASYPQVQHGL